MYKLHVYVETNSRSMSYIEPYPLITDPWKKIFRATNRYDNKIIFQVHVRIAASIPTTGAIFVT